MTDPACPSSLWLTIGRYFFQYRDLLPVPLVLYMFRVARPRRWTWILGIPLVLLGEALRVWGLCHIGPTTRAREICADRLVTSGPYQWVRHPLYLANLLKVLGLLVIAGNSPFALIGMLFYATEFSAMIPYEESFLEAKFPEQFKAWALQVPALFPVQIPTLSSDSAPFSLMNALYSERRTFVSTGILLAGLAFISLKGSKQDDAL